MKETYTLYINSLSSTGRIGSTIKSYQYYINWSAVLPHIEDIEQKYKVRYIFTNVTAVGLPSDVFSLNVDFGSSNFYSQSSSKTTFLGYIYPVATSVNGYYRADFTNNTPVTIEYPSNSLITVNIGNINSASGTAYNVDYALTLEFTPI